MLCQARFLSTARARRGAVPSAGLARHGLAAFDHDGFDLARTFAPERGGLVVFLRGETGDALLEGGELDDHEAVEFLRAFHDLIAPTTRQDLAAVFGKNRRNAIRVLLVFDRIDDPRTRHPVSRHPNSPSWLISANPNLLILRMPPPAKRRARDQPQLWLRPGNAPDR